MTWWSAAFLAAITVATVVIVTWGMRAFNADRARSVKHAEQIDRGLQDQVVLVARTHPEVVRVARLDRHPFYLGSFACILGYAICVFSGATLTSNVTSLGGSTRTTMAWTFLLGSLLVLAAGALGTTLFGKTIKPSVRIHPTCDALGDDISLPYRLASAGMSVVAVGAAIYSWTSFTSDTGTSASLGGWLTGGVATMSVLTIILMFFRTRFFEKWDAVLTREARQRMEADDAAG